MDLGINFNVLAYSVVHFLLATSAESDFQPETNEMELLPEIRQQIGSKMIT